MNKHDTLCTCDKCDYRKDATKNTINNYIIPEPVSCKSCKQSERRKLNFCKECGVVICDDCTLLHNNSHRLVDNHKLAGVYENSTSNEDRCSTNLTSKKFVGNPGKLIETLTTPKVNTSSSDSGVSVDDFLEKALLIGQAIRILSDHEERLKRLEK